MTDANIAVNFSASIGDLEAGISGAREALASLAAPIAEINDKYAALGAALAESHAKAAQAVRSGDDAAYADALRAAQEAISGQIKAEQDGLRDKLSSYVDDEMVGKIAQEHSRGRLLMIATTNLDAGRPVIWNIGAIAQSGHPMAKEAIRRILLASASIPGVFPPVMFDIELDGHKFQEMHGDGGATAQTFLYPPSISIKRHAPSAAISRGRTAYIIRNGKLLEDWKETERKTLSIAGRAVSTLISSSGVGDMYRIFGTTRRDGVNYNLALIESDFQEPYKGPFNREYMNKLFEYGRDKSRAGYPWRKSPPGFAG